MGKIFEAAEAEMEPLYDFTQPSHAVIASDGSNGCVLYHVGGHLDYALCEWGFGSLENLGLDNAPEGVSVWTGRLRSGFTCGEHDEWLEGEFRDPTPDEWACIVAGRCPFAFPEPKK